MSVTYLTTPIAEARRVPPSSPYAGMTREGYTKRSGAPSSIMIRLQGEKKWRRVMVWQFSNVGTLFVRLKGAPHVIRETDLPTIQEKGAAHSTIKRAKKSPAELDRDINEVLGKDYRVLVRVEGAPKPVHTSPWMTRAQAEHAAKNHKAMIRDRGWTQVVEIEDASGGVTRIR